MSASTQVFYPSPATTTPGRDRLLVGPLGFEVAMVVDGDGERDVAHASCGFGSGMIMLGSESNSADKWVRTPARAGSTLRSRIPTALHERAKAAWRRGRDGADGHDYARATRDPRPEGNLWKLPDLTGLGAQTLGRARV